MLETLLQRSPKCAQRPRQRHPAALLQPGPHLGLGQMENQVVGPQTGDVGVRIEPLQRVIEIVGQKDRLDVTLVQDRLRPVGAVHLFLGGVIQRLPIVRRDLVVLEPEELLTNLDQPMVVGRVGDVAQPVNHPANQFARPDPFFLDLDARHAGGMNEFGVVVIPQDVSQRAGRRRMGIDVRVGVDQSNRGNRLIDRLASRGQVSC